jgi:hypothetical protein
MFSSYVKQLYEKLLTKIIQRNRNYHSVLSGTMQGLSQVPDF